MNKILKKNINLSLFIVCTVISLIIWFSMSMSKEYQISYDIPVVYKNLPINQKIVKNQSSLKTIVKSTGWDLIAKKIKKRKIEIDLDDYESSEVLNIPNAKSLVKEAFSDINILDVIPLTFTLKFEKLLSKKVPVKLNVKKKFATNFHLNNSTIISPDSIIITSDANLLDEILFLETIQINITESDTTRNNIKIIIPENVKSNITEINAIFDIEEFAEKELIVPINIQNKPKNTDLVFYPEEISLKCLIPFTEFEKIIASDFYISADFNNIEVSKNNTLELNIGEHPKSVKNIHLGKDKIEFIIYSN